MMAVVNYNFPTTDSLDINQITHQFEQIFSNHQNAFKINLSFGLILQNIETRKYRYFVPYRNENLFNAPMLIRNRNDLNQLRFRLQGMDIVTYALKQRPDTKFKPVLVTNIVYSVYRTSFPLGISQGLPGY